MEFDPLFLSFGFRGATDPLCSLLDRVGGTVGWELRESALLCWCFMTWKRK